jgi:hypothetical protein
MSLSAEVVLDWADGSYNFALKAKQIEELEHLTGVGIGRLSARVTGETDFYYRDVRETIRLALIGGGTPATEATRLVNAYVDGQPLQPLDAKGVPHPDGPLLMARAILGAVRFGFERLPTGTTGEPQPATTESTSDSTEPHS